MADRVFSRGTKQMLKNVIGHTNSHNKAVEESEMWQQFNRMKQQELGGLNPSNPSYGHDDRCDTRAGNRSGRGNDRWNGSSRRDLAGSGFPSKRAHMDEEGTGSGSFDNRSTYWSRQLEKAESADPNRWDHSGYRELYPNDFKSDRSDVSSSESTGHRQSKNGKPGAKKKKKKHEEKQKLKEKKKKKSSRKHKKRSKKKHHSRSDEDTDSDSDASDSSSHRHRVERQHTKKMKKSRRHDSADSSSCSESDSDSGRERQHTRKRTAKKRTGSLSSSSSSCDSVVSPDQKRARKCSESQKSKKHKHKTRSDRYKISKHESENRRVVDEMSRDVNGRTPRSGDRARHSMNGRTHSFERDRRHTNRHIHSGDRDKRDTNWRTHSGDHDRHSWKEVDVRKRKYSEDDAEKNEKIHKERHGAHKNKRRKFCYAESTSSDSD